MTNDRTINSTHTETSKLAQEPGSDKRNHKTSHDHRVVEPDINNIAERTLDIPEPSIQVPVVTPTPAPGRPMQKGRFMMGMLYTALGIGLMLAVAIGALQDAGVNGQMSLPAVGLCMVAGIMLLGGGFGVMATSSPTFDDDEFERLTQNTARRF